MEKYSVKFRSGKFDIVFDNQKVIFAELDDLIIAEEITKALNKAYEVGFSDCENRVKENLIRFLFE